MVYLFDLYHGWAVAKVCIFTEHMKELTVNKKRPHSPILPLEGISLSCFIIHTLSLYLLDLYFLTFLMCCLCPLSGEYAIAEYSEVKTVTIKVKETI